MDFTIFDKKPVYKVMEVVSRTLIDAAKSENVMINLKSNKIITYDSLFNLGFSKDWGGFY
jgi:hypothetical protein